MTGFPKDVQDIILARSSGMCEVMLPCCTFQAVEIQHRRARGAGGTRRPETNYPSNGLAVCRPCHSFIESHPLVALEKGWRVPQSLSPAQESVVWRQQRLWLDDFGGFERQEERDVG